MRHKDEGGPMSALGQKADITTRLIDVRFTPESRHRLSALGCPLSAKSGHMRRSKAAMRDHLVGAAKPCLQHREAERRADQRRSSLPAKFGNVGRDLYRQELQV